VQMIHRYFLEAKIMMLQQILSVHNIYQL